MRKITIIILGVFIWNMIPDYGYAKGGSDWTEYGIIGLANSKMNINSKNLQVDGDIYSNGDFNSEAVNLSGRGSINAVGKINIIDSEHIEKNKHMKSLEMENIFLDIDGETKENREIFKSEKFINENTINMDKNYYGEKSISINSAIAKIEGSILADKEISISASQLSGKNKKQQYIASKEGNISISGASVEFEGIIYAPNGKVTINAAQLKLTGKIIAKEVELTGDSIKFKEAGDMNFISSELPKIEIDDTGLKYSKNRKSYIIDKKLGGIEGGLSKVRKVESFKYEIEDFKKNIVQKGTIEIKLNWKIENVKLNPGVNTLKLKLVMDDGQEVDKEIIFVNLSKDNVPDEILKTDTDGDKLCDYLEEQIGSDKLKKDTDSDGLNDYEECFISKTKFDKKDTNNNEIIDSKEDIDNDKLTNREEIDLGLNLFNRDTDDDGLEDFEEVVSEKTNPTSKDTDKDTLEDGFEKEVGLNPLKKDSDSNGVEDGAELIKQKKSLDIENSEVNKVEIITQKKGNVVKAIDICDIKETDSLSSGVVGLRGNPIEINSEIELKNTTIKFKCNMIGKENNIDNLAVLKYNEKDNLYEILDTKTVIDAEEKTVTYTGNIDGKYMLVDKEEWYNTWKNEIDYKESENGESSYYCDIGFVVDNSGSMRGDRLEMTKGALLNFINALNSKDQSFLVGFNDSAKILCEYGATKEELKEKNKGMIANGLTDTNEGLVSGIAEINRGSNITNSKNKKILVMICDGDVRYVQDTVNLAKNSNIKVHTINIMSSASDELKKISSETKGKYFHADRPEDLIEIIEEIKKITIEDIDRTDTDEDGLYDVYEEKGVRIPNGEIIKTDSKKVDTDGDGLSDYDELGGKPVQIELDFEWGNHSAYINNMYKSNPNMADSDGDGVKDGEDRDKLNRNNFKVVDNYEDFPEHTKLSKERAVSDSTYATKIGEYSELELTRIHTEAALVSIGGSIITPVAANILAHYLSDSGEDYKINVDSLLKDTTANKYHNRLVDSLKRYIEDIEILEGETIIIQSIKGNDGCDVLCSFDWHAALGTASSGIVAKVTKNRGKYNIKYKYIVYDYYDWEEDNWDDEFLPGLSDPNMYKLHVSGWARQFYVSGYSEKQVNI